jgi:integrase
MRDLAWRSLPDSNRCYSLETGCRYGELCALKVSDLDPENSTLVIRHSKSGRPRHVYLTEEGAAFFEALSLGRARDELMVLHADGTPWRPSHQHRPMREACLNARIDPPVSFHSLRHSYASALTKAGVPLQVVASALGHADARMTEKHYAHLAPSHVAQLIRDNLPPLESGAPRKPRKVARLRG